MALVHRPWIVRVLIYVGTGIALLVGAATAAAAAGFLLWGLIEGLPWLQWSIRIPLLLILLALLGRNFYRERSR